MAQNESSKHYEKETKNLSYPSKERYLNVHHSSLMSFSHSIVIECVAGLADIVFLAKKNIDITILVNQYCKCSFLYNG